MKMRLFKTQCEAEPTFFNLHFHAVAAPLPSAVTTTSACGDLVLYLHSQNAPLPSDCMSLSHRDEVRPLKSTCELTRL